MLSAEVMRTLLHAIEIDALMGRTTGPLSLSWDTRSPARAPQCR